MSKKEINNRKNTISHHSHRSFSLNSNKTKSSKESKSGDKKVNYM